MLARAANADEANARVRAIAEQIQSEEGIADASQRIDSVAGDVSLDHCGLSPAQLERIINETTHIIHGAATIRFDHPIEEARAINCGGTRRLLAIAHMCAKRGNFKRFVYIGSSSVSGQRGGSIFEDELEMGQRFFSTKSSFLSVRFPSSRTIPTCYGTGSSLPRGICY